MTDDVVRNWWKGWIAPDTSAARANRARLRRAQDWQAAMLEPAAINLAKRLGAMNHDPRLNMALSLASVLAHVKEDTPHLRLMRTLGYTSTPTEKGKGSDQPKLAAHRFTRLMRSTPDEFPLAMTRLVRLAGNSANVSEIGKAMMNWVFEDSRERQRKRWAFDYYAASNAAPTDPEQETPDSEGTSA